MYIYICIYVYMYVYVNMSICLILGVVSFSHTLIKLTLKDFFECTTCKSSVIFWIVEKLSALVNSTKKIMLCVVTYLSSNSLQNVKATS